MARPRDAGRLRYRLSAGPPFGALCRHRAGAQRSSHRLRALARARARPVERPQAVPPLRALRRRPLRQRRLRAARARRHLRRLGIGFRAGGAAGEQRRAALLFRRNLIRSMLSEQMQLAETVWSRLNWSWIGFFAFMGAANLYVAYNYSTDLWVNFKLFGGMGLMLVFVVVQALFLARYVEEKQ